MPTQLYAGGLGGTVDLVATDRPFYGLDANAWYVHFATGVDAAAPAGRDKQAPLKTLAQAVTNATPNDIIVLLDGHDEVFTAQLAITKQGLVIVGCGQTAGVPNVKLQLDSALNAMISIQAPGVALRNLRIRENAQLNTFNRVVVTAADLTVDGCYFECGPNDNGVALALHLGADDASVRDTTFISTALVPTARPVSGLSITNAAGVRGLKLDGLVVSDGVCGFSSHYGLDLSVGPVTDLKGDRVSLLLGASAKLGAATGYLIPTITGGGAIDP